MKDTIIALSTKLTVDVEQATANLSVEDSRHCRHFAANSLLCNAIISAEDYMVGFCATLGSMAEAIQARAEVTPMSDTEAMRNCIMLSQSIVYFCQRMPEAHRQNFLSCLSTGLFFDALRLIDQQDELIASMKKAVHMAPLVVAWAKTNPPAANADAKTESDA